MCVFSWTLVYFERKNGKKYSKIVIPRPLMQEGGTHNGTSQRPSDGVSDLVSKAFTPTHVCYNPKIYTGHAVCGVKGNIKGSPAKDKG